MLFAIFRYVDQKEALPKFNSKVAAIYLSPPIEQSPHRGPPSISC